MKPIRSKTRLMTTMICLVGLNVNSAISFAQSPATPNRMFIQILDGEGALNDIRGGTAREPIVQIEDENHKPIAGVLVIFSTPSSGPSATFSNGLTSFQTTTLSDGRAIASGFKPNGISGTYQVQVHASSGDLSSQAVINQTNVTPPSTAPAHAARALPVKVIAIIAAAAGGAAVAGFLATRGQHSDTLTAGNPTAGGP